MIGLTRHSPPMSERCANENQIPPCYSPEAFAAKKPASRP
jgi:hypothetical protein